MNTSHGELRLRRRSIRTLTAAELRSAHGGKGSGGTTGQAGVSGRVGVRRARRRARALPGASRSDPQRCRPRQALI